LPIDASKLSRIKSAFSAEETARRRWTGPPAVDEEVTITGSYITKSTLMLSPYEVVLEFSDGSKTVYPFETMRAGEAFIRSEAPIPLKLGKMRETPNHG
jgi:hypothetical protein